MGNTVYAQSFVAFLYFNFTQFVILENLSILDLAPLGEKVTEVTHKRVSPHFFTCNIHQISCAVLDRALAVLGKQVNKHFHYNSDSFQLTSKLILRTCQIEKHEGEH